MYAIENNKLRNKYEVMLAICLFTSVDTILFGTNINLYMLLVPRIISIIGIILFFNFRSIKRKLFTGVVLFLFIPLMSFIINDADISTAISKILFILLGSSIASRFSIYAFFKVYDKVLYYVSCAAILLEIIVYIAPYLCKYFFRITNEAGSEYISIFISSINIAYIQSYLIRSSGIYWEAGAFAGYLLFGLIAQLFIFEKIDIKRIILYLICMIFTFSTTGTIAVSILLITYIFGKKSFSINDKRLKIFLITIVVLLFIFFVFGTQTIVYDKIFGKITSNASTTRTRVASLIVPFYIANNSPLFGVSPNKIADSMIKFASMSSFNLQASSMCTNTFTYQFAAYGYIFGFLFLLRHYFFSKKIVRNNLIFSIGIMLSIVLMYAGENFYSFLPFVFVFLSYKKIH